MKAGAFRASKIAFVVVALTWATGAGSAWAQEEDHPPRYDQWPPPRDLFSDEWELEWPVMPEDPVRPEPPRSPEQDRPPSMARPSMARRAPRSIQADRPHPRSALFDFDRHSRLQLSLYALPAVGFAADKDWDQPEEEVLFEADLRSGRGLAAQLTITPEKSSALGVGFLYLLSEHTERDTEALALVHAGFVEVVIGGTVNEGPLELSFYFAAGVGGLAVDFDRAFDDTGGMAGELRVQTGLRVLEAVELQVGAGYILWGWYPEEAVGHVGFLNLGLALRF